MRGEYCRTSEHRMYFSSSFLASLRLGVSFSSPSRLSATGMQVGKRISANPSLLILNSRPLRLID
jgi:hypothetical protein